MLRTFIFQILMFCSFLLFTSCKDDDTVLNQVEFEIDQNDLKHELLSGAARLSIPVKTNLKKDEWKLTTSEKWLFPSKTEDYNKNIHISINVNANLDKATRTGVVEVEASEKKYTISITQYGKDEVNVSGDLLVKPEGAKASESYPGLGIELTYDGKFDPANKHFHTPWGKSAKFPVTMDYFFKEGTELDYLIYYPRAGNGNFGELSIEICTDKEHKNFKKIADLNFYMSNSPSKYSFSKTTALTGVRFSVKSGLANYVSCDEMEFYRINKDKPLDKQLLTVFKDITCSELNENVSDEMITQLPSRFALLAGKLKNNTYDAHEKQFRIHEYEPYSVPSEWAHKLMTRDYGILDNPTGISVNKDDEIIVLVGDTHGQTVSLRSIWDSQVGGEHPYMQTNINGENYMLTPGVNKLKMREQGQLFVLYNTDITAAPKPIKIHIVPGSGEVTGYFDLKQHKTDEVYKEILSKASHKYFCVKGEKIMFYFHRSKMLEFVPNNILSAINLWDDIIRWEQELMGIEDVCPKQFNNHIFAISPEGSYMWATSGCIAFVYTKLGDILLKENVMAQKDNAWGPAHEIGHIHQAAINWPGSTESSNNLFSNYIMYKLGKYCSRGSELSALATARCVNHQGWWNMGTATHQNEDTEVHMRMNWQLWNYYHRCGYKKDFWQTLFKRLRQDRIVESNPGEGQLKFAMNACAAANENLTEFFERWGFFEKVDTEIEQYGKCKYKVTDDMISKAKAYMAKFPTPKHAFYYIEDRRNGDVGIENYKVGDVGYYTQFKDNMKITKKPSYTISGKTISIADGSEAVAFEVKRNDKLLFFSNFFRFEVPQSIAVNDIKVYAVQADGKRIEVTKK